MRRLLLRLEESRRRGQRQRRLIPRRVPVRRSATVMRTAALPVRLVVVGMGLATLIVENGFGHILRRDQFARVYYILVEWTSIQVSCCRKAVLRSVDNFTTITFLHDFSQNSSIATHHNAKELMGEKCLDYIDRGSLSA